MRGSRRVSDPTPLNLPNANGTNAEPALNERKTVMKKHYLSALMVGTGFALAAGTALAGPDCGKAGKRSAAHFERLDANKDGKVTLAELTQSKESWLSKVDANKDGVATTAEVEQSQKARHAQRIARMFEKRDLNKDGRLTREESQMPERWFARSDTNRDGALTAAELGERASQGKAQAGKARGKRGGKLAHLDQNADGKVEREEVRKSAARMLERLDRNADGSLTSDELGRRGRGHGKGRRGPGPDAKPTKPVAS